MSDLFEGIIGIKSDDEPTPDIAKCSKCGWSGPASECETDSEGDWESGYYDIHLCPKCKDGGCVDDYSMSPERAAEWEMWHKDKDKPKCCVCGTTENLRKDGWYGYRCSSSDCVCL